MKTIPPLFLDTPLQLEARQETLAEQSTRFTGVAYTGAVLSQWGFRYIVDLSTTTVPKTQPLLSQHDHTNLVGLVKSAANDGKQITESGELFADLGGTAEDIAKRAAKGVPYQMSIGIYDIAEEARVKEGEKVTVNGRRLTGPLTILRGGVVRETSVVVLGADKNTNAQFFSALGVGDPNMTDENIEELRARAEAAETEALAAQERIETLESELNELRLSAREADVRSLFSAIGREFTEESSCEFMAMPAQAFAAVKEALLKSVDDLKKSPLFKELASDEPAAPKPKAVINTAEIYAKRNQVGG